MTDINKISALIVDDEANSRKVLMTLLRNFCKEVDIVAEAGNIEEAFAGITHFKPQLVFLDIQMPHGSGFDLLRKFQKIPFETIFVTSFDKYAINAIRFSALDYLMKPVEVADLTRAVQRARDRITDNTNRGEQFLNLLYNMQDTKPDPRMAVHASDKVHLLKLSEIAIIEGENRYSNIHSFAGQKYMVTRTLKEFEDMLSDYNYFIRINKEAIVNINAVTNYTKAQPFFVDTCLERTFEISRRKKQDVLERLRELKL